MDTSSISPTMAACAAYSIRTTGPIVFGFAFMMVFYGIEVARERNHFSKAAFGVSLVLLVIVLVLNLIFIPKLGTGYRL